MSEDQGNAGIRGEDCKLITDLQPDDGIHRKLLNDLRAHRKAVRVSSQSGSGDQRLCRCESKARNAAGCRSKNRPDRREGRRGH